MDPKDLKAGIQTKTVHSSTIHNSQKVSTTHDHQLMNKVCCIHTMEYYVAIKRNKELKDATTWMNLKNIVLYERNQKQKAICFKILFI
jgi:hypothetical protein